MQKPELTHEFMTELKERLIEETKTFPLQKQFTMHLAKPDTWIISWYNPSLDTPRTHVLIGKKYALVIDPTEVPYNLRKYIEEYVTDKPIKVACTHAHADHTLANYQFNDCEIFMSLSCWEEIQEMRKKDWSANPRWAIHQKGDYVPTIIKPGSIIDIGEREIEVLPYNPCHSKTSSIFLDKTEHILFPGDEIDPDGINMWGTSVESFKNNMLSLKKRRKDFDMICPAHNGTPIHADTIDNFIENCNRIMNGIEGDIDKGTRSYLLNPFETRPQESIEARRFDPSTRRSEWKGTGLNYNINLIYDSQLKDYKGEQKK